MAPEEQIESIEATEKALTGAPSTSIIPTATTEIQTKIVDVETASARSNEIRAQVNAKQAKNAEMMSKKHDHKKNKRTLEFEVGETVSVLIPPIDRGGSQLPRAPGVVCRLVKENDLYEICTKYGILKDCLRAGDLEPYHGVIDFDFNQVKNKISLREVSTKISCREKDLKDIEVSCQCTGKVVNV